VRCQGYDSLCTRIVHFEHCDCSNPLILFAVKVNLSGSTQIVKSTRGWCELEQTSVWCRHERQVFWEQEKQEAAEYKERRRRLHGRMQQARTARIAKALASQWPASTVFTRHDYAAAGFFATGCALISMFWISRALPQASTNGAAAADEAGAAAEPVDTAPPEPDPQPPPAPAAWPVARLLAALWPETGAAASASGAQRGSRTWGMGGAREQPEQVLPRQEPVSKEVGRARLQVLESALRAELPQQQSMPEQITAALDQDDDDLSMDVAP
jgi:hypothetical protein